MADNQLKLFSIAEQASKICSRCGIRKPVNAFALRYIGPRGPHYRSKCKTCERVYNVDLRTPVRKKLNQRRRELYKQNEKYKTHARGWYQRNKAYFVKYRENPENRKRKRDAEKARRRKETPAQRERRLLMQKCSNARRRQKMIAYRQQTKARANAKKREWRKRNRDKDNDYRNRRRAIKYGSPFTEKIARRELIARDGSFCYLCGKVLLNHEVTLDHVIPLSRGGEHSYDNLKIACRPCNVKKHTRTLVEFLAINSNH